MRYLALIQARCGSTRFPNKVLTDLSGKPDLQWVIERVRRSRHVDEVMVVTSIEKDNLPLIKLCTELDTRVFVGSEDDVLDRYYQAAKLLLPDYVIRITADCPLFDWRYLDMAIEQMDEDTDYLAELTESFPDGLDIEIIRYPALAESWRDAKLRSEREHVTQFIRKHPERYRLKNLECPIQGIGDKRWTFDEGRDHEMISRVYQHFISNGREDFVTEEIIGYLREHPEIESLNKDIQRNEGLKRSLEDDGIVDTLSDQMEEGTMSKSLEFYDRAKRVIPGGTQLLSKRPEMWLPEHWPAYYSRAKGCEVWDLDGEHYYDLCIMGVGANVLGYAFDEVDDAVKEAISNGSMCTLNAPEEVLLAEKLLELHPWADSVRYAKAGGEGMSMAARIARAYTKKDVVLVCGYHGWHDWYLSANLVKGDPLADVHLKGLAPAGVPRGLAGTNLIFHYNDIDEFKRLIGENRGDIAAVIMEPIRNDHPSEGYLEEIRRITREEGIVLVFDEITSGFRLCAGGAHKVLGVDPDMAVFAKGMTNGYPVAAVIGTKEVMEAAQETFISSTFWTERVGFAGALKTIECYIRYDVSKRQNEVGKKISDIWRGLAKRYSLDIHISGILPLIHFAFGYEDPLAYKTYFTQEMLKEGFLAGTGVYASLAHKDEIIEKYAIACDRTFGKIARIVGDGEDITEYLEGPVCHAGFERLN